MSRHRRDAEPEEIAAQNEEKPAPAPSTAAPPKQRPRQLEEEVEEIPYIFVNDGHVLLALRKVNITNKKTSPDQTLTLEGNTFALTVENATEDLFIAVLTSGAHKLSLETSQSAGTWKINFRYNDNVETNEKFHARTSAVGYGPDWSFGCGELYVESFDHEIVLIGFQFQPFFEPATENLDSRNFTGRVSDCVGYFSPGIWGALFVIIILVSILSYGLTMMMDIKTMDKFDDPKGKTIIVNAQD